MSAAVPAPSTADVSTSATRISLRIAAAVWVAVAGLGIVGSALTTVQDFLTGIYSEFSSTDYVDWFAPQLIALVAYVLAWALPVAAGVFVSLRFVAPVVASAPVGGVLARGVVATVLGAAFGVILTLPLSIILSVASGDPTGGGLLGALAEMARRSVEVAPVVELIVLLGWLWLRRTPAV